MTILHQTVHGASGSRLEDAAGPWPGTPPEDAAGPRLGTPPTRREDEAGWAAEEAQASEDGGCVDATPCRRRDRPERTAALRGEAVPTMAPTSRKRPPARRPGPRVLPVLLAAAALVAAAVGGYVIARQTSIFALQRIQVQGAPPAVAAQIRATLSPYVGRSLVRFDAGAASRRLAAVSDIADASFDRAFPHTLKVRVRLERPVAVLRRGADAWLVSASARVLAKLDRRPFPRLPRIWLPLSTDVVVNSTLGGPGAKGVAALAPLRSVRVGADVRQVLTGPSELTLVLASGTELRLGDSGDLRLKLSIARQLLPLTVGARYVDISVPERPVASYNPKVGG